MREVPTIASKHGGKTISNALSRAAAERESELVRQYWEAFGHKPKIWVAIVMRCPVSVELDDGKHITVYHCGYGVRSDMVNGVPETYRGLFPPHEEEKSKSRDRIAGIATARS